MIQEPKIIYHLWEDSQFHSMLTSLGPKKMNRKVKCLLWLFSSIVSGDKRLEHKPFVDCIAITNKWLRAALGQIQADEFAKGQHALNNYLQLEHYGSGKKGYCNAYKLTGNGLKLKERISNTILLTNSANWHRFIYYNHRAKRLESSPVKDTVLPQEWDFVLPCRITEEAQHIQEVRLFTLIHPLYSIDGTFRQYYKRYDSGRLYAQGCTLQTVKKELRNKITQGQWSFDIECCAPTVLYQLFQQTNKQRLHGLEFYVNDRSELRQELASYSGLSESLIKSTLIPLFFGGSAIYPTSEAAYRIIKELDTTSREAFQVLTHLKSHNAYKALAADVKTLFNQVSLKGIPEHRKTQNEKVAWLYQSYESKILNSIINFKISKTQRLLNRTSLLIHDGLVTQQQININQLQNYIQKKTGFTLKIEGEIIKP